MTNIDKSLYRSVEKAALPDPIVRDDSTSDYKPAPVPTDEEIAQFQFVTERYAFTPGTVRRLRVEVDLINNHIAEVLPHYSHPRDEPLEVVEGRAQRRGPPDTFEGLARMAQNLSEKLSWLETMTNAFIKGTGGDVSAHRKRITELEEKINQQDRRMKLLESVFRDALTKYSEVRNEPNAGIGGNAANASAATEVAQNQARGSLTVYEDMERAGITGANRAGSSETQ